ncbi:MAG: hypothetical protein ABIH41_05135 [Nanoarchaeota archaeon]
MTNRHTIIAVLLALSLLINIGLFYEKQQLAYKDSHTTELLRETSRLIDALEERCAANKYDIEAVTACLVRINDKYRTTQVTETSFVRFNTKTNESGYLIIENRGKAALDSANFTLRLNQQIQDIGCRISGEIQQDFPCRLDFTKTCESGDALSVEYQNETIHVRPC